MNPNTQETFAVGDTVYLDVQNNDPQQDVIFAIVQIFAKLIGPFTVFAVGNPGSNGTVEVKVNGVPIEDTLEISSSSLLLACSKILKPGILEINDRHLTHLPPLPLEDPSVGPH